MLQVKFKRIAESFHGMSHQLPVHLFYISFIEWLSRGGLGHPWVAMSLMPSLMLADTCACRLSCSLFLMLAVSHTRHSFKLVDSHACRFSCSPSLLLAVSHDQCLLLIANFMLTVNFARRVSCYT